MEQFHNFHIYNLPWFYQRIVFEIQTVSFRFLGTRNFVKEIGCQPGRLDCFPSCLVELPPLTAPAATAAAADLHSKAHSLFYRRGRDCSFFNPWKRRKEGGGGILFTAGGRSSKKISDFFPPFLFSPPPILSTPRHWRGAKESWWPAFAFPIYFAVRCRQCISVNTSFYLACRSRVIDLCYSLREYLS